MNTTNIYNSFISTLEKGIERLLNIFVGFFDILEHCFKSFFPLFLFVLVLIIAFWFKVSIGMRLLIPYKYIYSNIDCKEPYIKFLTLEDYIFIAIFETIFLVLFLILLLGVI